MSSPGSDNSNYASAWAAIGLAVVGAIWKFATWLVGMRQDIDDLKASHAELRAIKSAVDRIEQLVTK